MGLFSDPNEAKRKANLKDMEDKRLRFAEKCRDEGFAPERMLLVSSEKGGVIGLSRVGERIALVSGPDFGGEGDFVLEFYDELEYRREDFLEPSEGMGGILGLGKKGSIGFYWIVERPGGELRIPFIANRSSMAEVSCARNPLLNLRRRRGNANVVWDLPPMEKKTLKGLEAKLNAILGKNI